MCSSSGYELAPDLNLTRERGNSEYAVFLVTGCCISIFILEKCIAGIALPTN